MHLASSFYRKYQSSVWRKVISCISIIACFALSIIIFIDIFRNNILLNSRLLVIFMILLVLSGAGLWSFLFRLSISFGMLFLLMPRFLTIEPVFNFIDAYFGSLLSADYKSSMIESIGGMIGTVMAIFGALWADKFIEQQRVDEEHAKNARIVYYDFLFVFDTLATITKDYGYLIYILYKKPLNKRKASWQPLERKIFHNHLLDLLILIDDDWIKNVAALPEQYFTPDLRKHIYTMYDHICRLKHALTSIPKTIDYNSQVDFEKKLQPIIHEIYWLLGYGPRKYAHPLLSQDSTLYYNLSEIVFKQLECVAKISKEEIQKTQKETKHETL